MKAKATCAPSNYLKHTASNPLQQYLLERFYTALLAQIRAINPKTILDAGCGEGFTLDRLTTSGLGKQLTGIDFSKQAIKIGKQQYPNLALSVGSIYKLPFPDNTFDVVLCTEVLEHLADPKAALQEIIRVSRRYLVLSVPNEPFFMAANFVRGKNLARFGNDIEHINHWTGFGFKRLLTTHGLQIITHQSPFPWTLIVAEKRTTKRS